MKHGQRRLAIRRSVVLIAAGVVVVAAGHGALAAPVWDGYGGDPQHTALSGVSSLSLSGGIRWSTTIDAAQPNGGVGDLYIHYGSPAITDANTVIVPLKTGTDSFALKGLNGATGAQIWQAPTDYTIPAQVPIGSSSFWFPSYSPVVTQQDRVYYAGAGGTVYYRDNLNAATPTSSGQIAFYGNSNYSSNSSAYNGSVAISTPITTDASGDIFFGYRVSGSNPLGLTDGIARITPSGIATYASIASLGISGGSTVAMNCAPAVTADGKTVYVAVSNGNTKGGDGITATGSLVALNGQNLSYIASAQLKDPKSGGSAYIPDSGTASPMIGSDGDVYMGVLDTGGNNGPWLAPSFFG